MFVFVIGNQRSGTTWLYQLIAAYFQVGYVNNLAARFWDDPIRGLQSSKELLPSMGVSLDTPFVSFKSSYGNTPAMTDPHEFGYFWRQYFNLEGPMSERELDNVYWDQLIETLTSMKSEFNGLPMVFKSAGMGFYAKHVAKMIPDSYFLYIKKDPTDVIEETLHARRKREGYSDWYGFQPFKEGELEYIRQAQPLDQVVEQVGRINSLMELNKPDHRLEIEYDSLKANPFKTLAEVSQVFGLKPRCLLDY